MVAAMFKTFNVSLKIDLDESLPDKVGTIANMHLGQMGVPVDMFV